MKDKVTARIESYFAREREARNEELRASIFSSTEEELFSALASIRSLAGGFARSGQKTVQNV